MPAPFNRSFVDQIATLKTAAASANPFIVVTRDQLIADLYRLAPSSRAKVQELRKGLHDAGLATLSTEEVALDYICITLRIYDDLVTKTPASKIILDYLDAQYSKLQMICYMGDTSNYVSTKTATETELDACATVQDHENSSHVAAFLDRRSQGWDEFTNDEERSTLLSHASQAIDFADEMSRL